MKPQKTYKEIVLDNSVLSAFSKIGRLKLLKEILADCRVCVAETVYREITFKDVLDAVGMDGMIGKWIRVEKADVSGLKDPSIDDGEAGTVMVALEKSALAVIDDLDGRRFAAKHKVRVIGTLALLRRAYEKKIATAEELACILVDLETKDAFRMNDELKRWVLRR
jgi:predicted nucleic acid-binding protein